MCTNCLSNRMQAPPTEWFEPKTSNPEIKPSVPSNPPEKKPEWQRMLEVYAFLFDAHDKKERYK